MHYLFYLLFILFSHFAYSNVQEILVPSITNSSIENQCNISSIPNLFTVRVYQENDQEIHDQDTTIILDYPFKLHLLGNNLEKFKTYLTPVKLAKYSPCSLVINYPFNLQTKLKENTANKTNFYTGSTLYEFKGSLNPSMFSTGTYYFCLISNTSNEISFHQGEFNHLNLKYSYTYSFFFLLFCGLICLALSALFSALTLGILALDPNELKVLIRCGDVNEKNYAKEILPIRNHGNFLLCTLVIGNTVADALVTFIMSKLYNGWRIVVMSSFLIVVFGQILPLAASTRYGLAIGAKTLKITHFFMLLTFPLAFPLSVILDKLLGEEVKSVYNKERLMEYIRVTTPFTKIEKDELNIISGALSLKEKTVKNVMKKLEDVYMLPLSTILTAFTIREIASKGYSRIPIYLDRKERVVGLLHVKDLIIVDPNASITLKGILYHKKNSLVFTHKDEKLSGLLNLMKEGKSHMALVKENRSSTALLVGMITLEDIIEEILQTEIADETDILTDAHKKHKKIEPFTNRININQWQSLALVHFMVEEIALFKAKHIHVSVLKKIVTQKIFYLVKYAKNSIKPIYLCKKNKSCDFFILILEGKVEVEVGKENFKFEAGPFNYFCIDAIQLSDSLITNLNNWIQTKYNDLSNPTIKNTKPQNGLSNDDQDLERSKLISDDSTNSMESLITFSPQIVKEIKQHNYVPDFSIKVIDSTVYLKITRDTYIAARNSSYALTCSNNLSMINALNAELDFQIDKYLNPFFN